MKKQEWINKILTAYNFPDQKEASNNLSEYWENSRILLAFQLKPDATFKIIGSIVGNALFSFMGYVSLPAILISSLGGAVAAEELFTRLLPDSNVEQSLWIRDMETALREAVPPSSPSIVLGERQMLLQQKANEKYKNDLLEYAGRGIGVIAGYGMIARSPQWNVPEALQPLKNSPTLAPITMKELMSVSQAGVVSVVTSGISNLVGQSIFKPISSEERKRIAEEKKRDREQPQRGQDVQIAANVDGSLRRRRQRR